MPSIEKITYQDGPIFVFLPSSTTTMPYSLFCIGNPLLDLQVTNGEELLKKYGLKANDAILAEEKHAGMLVSIFPAID